MNNQVTHVYLLGEKRLALRFSDGYVGKLDFADMDFAGITAPLVEDGYFQQARVAGSTIAWPNEYDICPDVLRLWCERDRVLSDEETHAAFSAHA